MTVVSSETQMDWRAELTKVLPQQYRAGLNLQEEIKTTLVDLKKSQAQLQRTLREVRRRVGDEHNTSVADVIRKWKFNTSDTARQIDDLDALMRFKRNRLRFEKRRPASRYDGLGRATTAPEKDKHAPFELSKASIKTHGAFGVWEYALKQMAERARRRFSFYTARLRYLHCDHAAIAFFDDTEQYIKRKIRWLARLKRAKTKLEAKISSLTFKMGRRGQQIIGSNEFSRRIERGGATGQTLFFEAA